MELVKIKPNGELILMKKECKVNEMEELRFMQEQVGGWFESIPTILPREFGMYVNENGNLIGGFEYNEIATSLCTGVNIGGGIVGDAIIVKHVISDKNGSYVYEKEWSTQDYESLENILKCKINR